MIGYVQIANLRVLYLIIMSNKQQWPETGAKYVQVQDFAKAAYQSTTPGGFIHAVVMSLTGLRNLETAKERNRNAKNRVKVTAKQREVQVPVEIIGAGAGQEGGR